MKIFWNTIYSNSTKIHCFQTEDNFKTLWFNTNQLKILHILLRKLTKDGTFYVWLYCPLQVKIQCE